MRSGYRGRSVSILKNSLINVLVRRFRVLRQSEHGSEDLEQGAVEHASLQHQRLGPVLCEEDADGCVRLRGSDKKAPQDYPSATRLKSSRVNIPTKMFLVRTQSRCWPAR